MAEIVIKCESEAIRTAVLAALIAAGGIFHKGEDNLTDIEEINKKYPFSGWNNVGFYDVGKERGSIFGIVGTNNNNKYNNLEEALKILTNLPKVYLVALNDEYIAEISKDGIMVGCQKISFEAFEEVCRAVEKAKKDER